MTLCVHKSVLSFSNTGLSYLYLIDTMQTFYHPGYNWFAHSWVIFGESDLLRSPSIFKVHENRGTYCGPKWTNNGVVHQQFAVHPLEYTEQLIFYKYILKEIVLTLRSYPRNSTFQKLKSLE